MLRTHPNADVANRLWSAIAEADPDALEEVLAPGVVWRSVGHNPVAGEYLGHGAVMEYLAAVGERADELVSTLGEIYVNDRGAVVVHRVQARRAERRLDMDYVIRLRIVDRRIVSVLSVPVEQDVNDAFWS